MVYLPTTGNLKKEEWTNPSEENTSFSNPEREEVPALGREPESDSVTGEEVIWKMAFLTHWLVSESPR